MRMTDFEAVETSKPLEKLRRSLQNANSALAERKATQNNCAFLCLCSG